MRTGVGSADAIQARTWADRDRLPGRPARPRPGHVRWRPFFAGTRPEKADRILSAGAEWFVCTREPGWWNAVGSVDRVFDLVGGELFRETVGLLTPGGRLVFVGGTAGGELGIRGWDLMRPVTLTGYSSEALTRDRLEELVHRLWGLQAAGRLSCREVTRFPLSEASAAHEALEAGRLAGRVVLVPG